MGVYREVTTHSSNRQHKHGQDFYKIQVHAYDLFLYTITHMKLYNHSNLPEIKIQYIYIYPFTKKHGCI